MKLVKSINDKLIYQWLENNNYHFDSFQELNELYNNIEEKTILFDIVCKELKIKNNIDSWNLYEKALKKFFINYEEIANQNLILCHDYD